MAYERTIWKNREVERPRTFEKIENPDGTITLVPAEGNIIEPGTPIIAENMNNIEQGIVDAHDLAQQAFQSASDGKTVIASSITAKGVPASNQDTFPTLASKIDAIETDKTGDATAVANDIRKGKTAYAKGNKLVGAIPENSIKQTITTQGGQINLPEGIIMPGSYVKAQINNLVAENIREGVNIGGVVGVLEPKQFQEVSRSIGAKNSVDITIPFSPMVLVGFSTNTSGTVQSFMITRYVSDWRTANFSAEAQHISGNTFRIYNQGNSSRTFIVRAFA